MNTVGTYVICEEICDFNEQGCNSRCYLARDINLNIEIAVKDIDEENLDETSLDTYFKEAQIAALAAHPKILNVMFAGFDPEKEIARVVTRYLSNGSLQAYIDRNIQSGRLISPKEVCEICLYVAQGLYHLHTLDIVHLDIKPSNVLLDANMQPVISDFGQSKLLKNAIEKAPSIYAKNFAPEIVQYGIVSKLTDIYQFGLLIYRLCNPICFEEQFEQITQTGSIEDFWGLIMNGEFPDRDNFPIHAPQKLIDICKKCLSLEPSQRYQDFFEIQNEIASIEALPLPWYLGENCFQGNRNGKHYVITISVKDGKFAIETKMNNRRKAAFCAHDLPAYRCRAKIKKISSEI